MRNGVRSHKYNLDQPALFLIPQSIQNQNKVQNQIIKDKDKTSKEQFLLEQPPLTENHTNLIHRNNTNSLNNNIISMMGPKELAIENLRRLLFETAKEQYRLMHQELDKPILKNEKNIISSLENWPAPNRFKWQGKEAQDRLYIEFHAAIDSLSYKKYKRWGRPAQEYGETIKHEILLWANYRRWAVARLERMDELLSTGELDKFFKICHGESGMFALENKLEQKYEKRTRLKPHYPNQTPQFRALEKEWKTEKEQALELGKKQTQEKEKKLTHEPVA